MHHPHTHIDRQIYRQRDTALTTMNTSCIMCKVLSRPLHLHPDVHAAFPVHVPLRGLSLELGCCHIAQTWFRVKCLGVKDHGSTIQVQGYDHRVVNEGVGETLRGCCFSLLFLAQSFRMVVCRPLQYPWIVLSYAAVMCVGIHFHLSPSCWHGTVVSQTTSPKGRKSLNGKQ